MFNYLNVRYIMESKSLRQKDVRERSGIPEGTLSNIFIGKTKNPTADNLELLADCLSCSIDDFFDRKLNPTNTVHNVNAGNNVKGNGNSVQVDIKAVESKAELEKLLLENELLKKMLQDKEERLKDKDRMIELLSNQSNK